MKSLLITFILLSFSALATESVIEPSIRACDEETIRDYVKPRGGSVITISKNIKIEAREIEFGDPAIWSILHMIKVDFPFAKNSKKACFLIDKAALTSAKSLEYDALKGRLLELDVIVATGDEVGNIGSKNIKLHIRLNQMTGKLSFEK